MVYSDEKSIINNSDTVYRELITWTKIDNMVYEIRYLVNKSDYLYYLPMVNHMINSFQIINKVKGNPMEIGSEEEIKTDDEDPLIILKRRFARGAITQEEYERMRRIIES